MHITLYKSKLCPRCYLAKKHILNLVSQKNEIIFEEVDIVTSPKRAWQDGIRMIPAVKIGQNLLSAAILTRSQLDDFIKNNTVK